MRMRPNRHGAAGRLLRAAVASVAIAAPPLVAAAAPGDTEAPGATTSRTTTVRIIRMPAMPGVSYNDAVESLKLRANSRNFKFVGVSPLSKEVEAMTGMPTPRTEIFSFCDAVTARQFIDVNLDFAAFLPCRVAVLEDANRKVWIVSMMMDMAWLEGERGSVAVPAGLRARAAEIIDILNDMINAAAKGEF
ncbi:MAG TPA: DUF302 domain-containing protein [Rhodocyclaceae bacterium]|nr:DUF302 domain-containing protein [Rhodocyclaceae bacterium]